jgi:hypothetical protein
MARRGDEAQFCLDERPAPAGQEAKLLRSVRKKTGERTMRSNSGGGKSSNDRGNPTLEEHERAHGHSGAAITGEKKVANEPDRQSARKRQTS